METDADPVIKNKEVFRENYIPDNLVHRGKDIENLADYLRDFIKKGENPEKNLSMVGESGTGKTAMVKIAQEMFEEKLELDSSYMVYVNCKSKSTAYKVFSKVATELDDEVPESGFDADYYFDRIIDFLEEQDGNLVIILDEVDFLYKKGGLDQFDIVLYKLGNHDIVSSIFISNEPDWEEVLEDFRTLRRVKYEPMQVDPYSKEELKDIMESRKDKGLKKDALYEEEFNYMVDFISEESADASKVIDLLYRSAKEAERNRDERIQKGHIKKAYDKIESSAKMRYMEGFVAQKKMIMLAIETLYNNGIEDITINKIYEMYKDIVEIVNNCKENVTDDKDYQEFRTLGKNSIYRKMDEFQSYGLIRRDKGAVDKGQGRRKDKIEPIIENQVFFQKLHDGDFQIAGEISAINRHDFRKALMKGLEDRKNLDFTPKEN